MTTRNLFSAALIAISMLSPAMARKHQHVVRDSYTRPLTPDTGSCARAPRVGAFATAPWVDPPCEPTDY